MSPIASINAITTALDAVMAIPIDELEKLMQHAHECSPNQRCAPPERFIVSRQALRMLWHFRCNIETITVFMERE